MSLIVQKFGGTSLGSPERIRAVAQKIQEQYAQGHKLIIVVSAMGNTTDDLIHLAYQVSKNPPIREMDMLLTVGERISMALLSMALSDLKVPALSLTGSQAGIVTDQSHRRARILKIVGHRVSEALDLNKVVIVAGFQGVSETKEVTTLGRGGSDTTAVALAAHFKADQCEIFTDVDGVYSSDPRIVSAAKLWKILSAPMMAEMALLGAGVLHPRCVELARSYQIKLFVKNTLKWIDKNQNMKNNLGTEITQKAFEEPSVVGVMGDLDRVLLEVTLNRPSVVTSLWSEARKSNLLFVAPALTRRYLQFFAERDSLGEWQKLFQKLAAEGYLEHFSIREEIVPLSIVGTRFGVDPTFLSEILDFLATLGIHPISMNSSTSHVVFGIEKKYLEEAIQKVHSRFLN